uniref:Polyprotein n=1 Tax=Placeda virus TaxID=2800940 RepID=A0A894KQN4_9VIRU|nr:MAG: polyprotein [Placeda virus]
MATIIVEQIFAYPARYTKTMANVVDDDMASFDEFLAHASVYDNGSYHRTYVALHAPLWDQINKCDYNLDVELTSLYQQNETVGDTQPPTNRLEKLWANVLKAKDNSELTTAQFNKCYRQQLIQAYRLRRQIYEIRTARLKTPHGLRKPCRFACVGTCRQCLAGSNYQEGLALEKIKINELLKIYDSFTQFINRPRAEGTVKPVKKLTEGQWLRLKGYTELNSEFKVWLRQSVGLHQRLLRNRETKKAKIFGVSATANERPLWSWLEPDEIEPMVGEDKPLPKFMPKRIKHRKSKKQPETPNKSTGILDNELAFWRAHTRKQRSVLFEAMSKNEQVQLQQSMWRIPYITDLIEKWRVELFASKFRTVKTTKPSYTKEEKETLEKLATNSMIKTKTHAKVSMVCRCDLCGRYAKYSSNAHQSLFCAYKKCKRYQPGSMFTDRLTMALGTTMLETVYQKLLVNQYEQIGTPLQPDIGNFKYVERNGIGWYQNYEDCVSTVHANDGFIAGDIKRVCDIYYKDNFSSITDIVSVNGINYQVNHNKLIAWSYLGRTLNYVKSNFITSDHTLISGTPVLNKYGQLCSVITSSNGADYAIYNQSNCQRNIFAAPSDVALCVRKLADKNGLCSADIFHATPTAQQAAATARVLAEARMIQAVVTGHTDQVTEEIKAIKQLQNIANDKMAQALTRTANITIPVRRKKKAKKPVVTTNLLGIIAVTIAILQVCYGVKPSSDLNILREIHRRPVDELNAKLIINWVDTVDKNLQLTDYYDRTGKDKVDYGWLSYIKNAWLTSNKNQVVGYLKKKMEKTYEEAEEIYTNTAPNMKDAKLFEKIRDEIRDASSQVSAAFRECYMKTLSGNDDLVLRDTHSIVKRMAEEDKENSVWMRLFGKSKESVIECLKPVVGAVSVQATELETTLKNHFAKDLESFDYEHPNCKTKRIEYEDITQCTKEGLFQQTYRDFAYKCDHYRRCKHHIKMTTELLSHTYDSNIVMPSVNYKTCEQEKEKLEEKYKTIKLKGHRSGISLTNQKTYGCTENVNWQSDGWLGGVAGSCVTGVTDESWKNRGCVSLPLQSCLSKPDTTCNIGWGNIIHKNNKLLSNTHKNSTTQKCCSLHCHDIDVVYEMFTHQPMCSECIKPFTPIFWTEQCLLMLKNKAISSISITQSRTTFEIESMPSVVCNNAWHFGRCCAGKGPAAYANVDTFKDKHCICSQRAPTFIDLLLKKILTLKNQFFMPVHLLVFIIIFFLYISHRAAGLAVLVCYLAWLIVSAEGACSVENLVPTDSTVTVAGQGSNFAQVKVKPGQCISVGDATIEIVSVQVMTIYNFLRVIPYHIKPVCQLLDWGCPAGKSDGVYNQSSLCYDNCVPGLRKQWKDSEYDWIGDKCFLNGRVATRYDVCFSYGVPNTFVELYTRLTGTPILKLQVKFHGIGFENVGTIETSNLGEDAPVTILDVVVQPVFWPEMITYRLGKYLCAYHYVESSDTCNSGDIFKPTDIDVDCLMFTKKWDTEHGGYQLDFAKRDFETQLHNNFVDCGLESEIKNNVTTLSYNQAIEWVEFKIVGNNFHFADSVPYCKNLNKWTIKAEAGLTYYHRRTQIKYTNSGEKCKIFVNIDGCYSTNGNLIVLSKLDNQHIIEYWCGANSTGTAHINIAEGKVETKELKVLNNFLPHKNTIRNGFEKIVRAATVTDVKSWFSSLFSQVDIHGLISYFSWIWLLIKGFSWIQIGLGVVLALLAWKQFMRGNMVQLFVTLIIMWLLCFTKIVFAEIRYTHGHYQKLNMISDTISKNIEQILSVEVDFVSVICYVYKAIYSYASIIILILGCYDILRIEQLLNKYTTILLFISCALIHPVLAVFVYILTHLNQILDRCSTMSSCENMGIGYNNMLTSWLTYNMTSSQESLVTETQDDFLLIDSTENNQPTRYIRNFIRCGSQLDPQKIILPAEVLNYRVSIIQFESYVITHLNGEIPTIIVASHCVDPELPESMLISSSENWKDFSYPVLPSFKPEIGFSGTPVYTDAGYQFFIGLADEIVDQTTTITKHPVSKTTKEKFTKKKPIYTTRINYFDLKFTYSTDTGSIINEMASVGMDKIVRVVGIVDCPMYVNNQLIVPKLALQYEVCAILHNKMIMWHFMVEGKGVILIPRPKAFTTLYGMFCSDRDFKSYNLLPDLSDEDLVAYPGACRRNERNLIEFFMGYSEETVFEYVTKTEEEKETTTLKMSVPHRSHVYTNKVYFTTLDWTYSDNTIQIVYGAGKFKLDKPLFSVDCKYLTNRGYYECHGGELSFATQIKNAIVTYRYDHTRPSKYYEKFTGDVVVELDNDSVSTERLWDAYIVEYLNSPEETVVDPFGSTYLHTPRGLVNDIIWPRHVQPLLGVEVCNDVMLKNRNVKLSTPALDNPRIYVFDFTDRTMNSEKITGDVWWPDTNLDETPKPVRLQHSKTFTSKFNYMSGSLIYVKKYSFFGTPIIVGTITKSYIRDSADPSTITYVVSHPSDEYVILSLYHNILKINNRWNSAEVNDRIDISGYCLTREAHGKHFINILDTKTLTTHHLRQVNDFFPVALKQHSPEYDQIVTAIMSTSIREHITKINLDFLKNSEGKIVDYAVDVLNEIIEMVIKKKDILIPKRCVNRKAFEVLVRQLYSSVQDTSIVDVYRALDYVMEIPNLPCRAVKNVADLEESKMAVNFVVLSHDEPRWECRASVFVHLTDDQDEHRRVKRDGGFEIVTSVEQASEQIIEAIHDSFKTGERFIVINITGTNIFNLPDIAEYIQFSLHFAITSVIVFVVDTGVKDRFTKLFEPAVPTTREHVEDLLAPDWRHNNFSTDTLKMGEGHLLSVKEWASFVGNGGYCNKTVTKQFGTPRNTLEEIGICNVDSEMMVGMLTTCVKRGSFFFYQGTLVTNWHVTKGCSVCLTYGGQTYTFKNPCYVNKKADVCMYGRTLKFAATKIGEVVTAFNPTAKFGIHYFVSKNQATLQGRGNVTFLKLVPMTITSDGHPKIATCSFFRGMSGSPIVNSLGQPVGIFGLGMVEDISCSVGSIHTTVNYSGVGEIKIESLAFFEMCAKNLVTAERTAKFFYCNAPTGAGKTTKLPPLIVKAQKKYNNKNCKILILQPNVVSVVNCAQYMHKVMMGLGISDKACKIMYEVGIRNADHSKTIGGERDTDSIIVIKTYGKQYETFKTMADYDYVVLDEVHVIRDVNVVSTIVRLENSPNCFPAQYIYMSATHLSTAHAIDLAEGETLATTPRPIITRNWTTQETRKSSTNISNEIVIAADLIPSLGNNAMVLDRTCLNDGLVLFFCATKKECERCAAFGKRQGVTSWAYHGDSSQSVFDQILEHTGNGWIFATDVIQQSVTLPELTVVVDFMTECRPSITLTQDPLSYKNEIVFRTIDLVTQTQRKGRLGRVKEGIYYSSGTSAAERDIEEFVIPDVVLKLLDAGLNIEKIECNNLQLQNKIRSYNWLSPNYLERHYPAKLREIKPSIVLDYLEKLELTKNKEIDRVKWYVRTYILNNEFEQYTTEELNTMFGDPYTQFKNSYLKHVVVATPKLTEELTLQGYFYTSFKEKIDNDQSMEVIKSDHTGETSNDQARLAALENQSMPVAVFAIGSCACVYAIIEKLVDIKSSRIVSHVSVTQIENVSTTARHFALTNNYVKSSTYISTMTWLSDARNWITANTGKIWSRMPWVHKLHTQSEFTALILQWLEYVENIISSVVGQHIDIIPALSGLFAGGIFGSIYRTLEKSVGRPMAIVITVSVSGLFTYYASLPSILSFATAHFASVLIRAAVSTSEAPFNTASYAGTAWSSVIGLFSGIGIGKVLKHNRQIFLAAPPISSAITDLTTSTRFNVGRTGLPVLLVKHFYNLVKFRKVSDALVAGLSFSALLLEVDVLTVAYSAVFGTLVFVLEVSAMAYFDKFVTRDYASAEGGEHLRNKKHMLENIVSTLLNTGALVVYPQSLVSILIGTIGMYLRNGDFKNSAKRSWEQYSGVSPLLALVAEVVNTISHEPEEQSMVRICNYFKNCWNNYTSKACIFFKNAWETIKNWFSRVFNTGVREVVDSCSAAITEQVKDTVIGKILNVKHSKAIEKPLVFTDDPAINHYLVTRALIRGLTSTEKYWLNLNPGKILEYGGGNPLFAEILDKKLRVTAGAEITSEAPLGFFKFRAVDVYDVISLCLGSARVEGNLLKSTIKTDAGCEFEVTFSNTFVRDKVTAIIILKLKYAILTDTIAWVVECVNHSIGSKLTVYEFNPYSSLVSTVVKSLSAVCGLQQGSYKQLTKEDVRKWYTRNFGQTKKPSLMVAAKNVVKHKTSDFIKNWVKLEQQVVEHLQPPYVFSPYIMPALFFSGDTAECEELHHARYWSTALSAHYNLSKPFTISKYFNTKWHLPNNFAPKWLKIDTQYDCSNYKELKLGLEFKTHHPWNTPILLTTKASLNKHLICLASLNLELTIKYTIQLDMEQETHITTDGHNCGKCLLHIYANDGVHYYKFFSGCNEQFSYTELDVDRVSVLINEMYDNRQEKELCSTDYLTDVLMKPSFIIAGAPPTSSLGNNVLDNTLLASVLKTDLVEMNSTILDIVLNFFELNQDPDLIPKNFSVYSRLSYLFTPNQLFEHEEFYDANEPYSESHNSVQGFIQPSNGRIQNWKKYENMPSHNIDVDPTETMHLYQTIKSVYKPKSMSYVKQPLENKGFEFFYRMQQLYEAYPEFFDNCQYILDPACGSGGQIQYLANKFKNKKPKLCFVNTLLSKLHSTPTMNRLSCGNFKTFNITHPSIGTGNLRNSRVVQYIASKIKPICSLDLIIVDIGHMFYSNKQNQDWWYNKDGGSIVDGIVTLLDLLTKGGKFLMSWPGIFAGGDSIWNIVFKNFKTFRFLRLATEDLSNPKFYVFCEGYNSNYKNTNLSQMYRHLSTNVHALLTKTKQYYFHPNLLKTISRFDWEIVSDLNNTYSNNIDSKLRVSTIDRSITDEGQVIKISWHTDWDKRLTLFKNALSHLAGRRIHLIEGNSGKFKHLTEVGYIIKKHRIQTNEKDSSNGLLQQLVWSGFRMNKLNSPVALTQTLPAQAEASFKKRLDITAPAISPLVMNDIYRIMNLLTSKYGRTLYNKLDICNKDEVLSMINNKGATSVISQTSTLKEFIAKCDDWYEICMKECVMKWATGKDTFGFFNVMHKNEPKAKKNFEGGKIKLERGSKNQYSQDELAAELQEHCMLGHRFIQYADEITRLSHYIVLGKLLQAANTQKLYKGTINGTPPFIVGNIMRAVWDFNSKKPFFTGDETQHGMKYDPKFSQYRGKEPAAVILDFSGFDGSVSIDERMCEAHWIAKFFKPHLKNTILNMCKEMAMVICIDHSGRVWLRQGQRGSGEVITSLCNTLICVANIVRVIASCTGSTFEEVCVTKTTLGFNVGGKNKLIEIMEYMIFADGDDVVLITDICVCRAFTNVAERVLTEAGKSIRSGNETGCKVVTDFFNIEFCSHSYEPVLIGPNANFIHTLAEMKRYSLLPGYKISFLPTRPTSVILGKLRATLKLETQQWIRGKTSDRSLEITRGKVISYLLLYPHMRYVRYTCIAALSLLGDGKTDLYWMGDRFQDFNFKFDTVAGALSSVHGVRDLDGIALRNYRADLVDARNIEYNATIINVKTSITLTDVTNRLFEFLASHQQYSVMPLDKKLTKKFNSFKETN